MPVGSLFVGRLFTTKVSMYSLKECTRSANLEGVCIIDSLAFLKKSAEPPIPLSILEPRAHVELAWPYFHGVIGPPINDTDAAKTYDINFKGSIHSNNTEASDDFW